MVEEDGITDCTFEDFCDHTDDTSGVSSLFARSSFGTAIFAGAAAAAAGVAPVLGITT